MSQAVIQLGQLFAATLVPATQKEAEKSLEGAAVQPGFLRGLFEVMYAPQAEPHIQQAASIYFKNTVYKRWLRDDGGISDEDKVFVKQHVLEALVQAPTSRVRDQLQEAMIFITKHEFPYQWEAFPAAIEGMMASGDSNRAYVGLLGIQAIVKKYEFKGRADRVALQQIIGSTFPTLLQMLQQCNQMPEAQIEEASRFTLLITRIFNTANQLHLSEHIMPDGIFHAWATEWANILMKPVPAASMELDETTCPQYRAKKVVMKGITRIIERYGNIDYAPDDSKQFAKGFIHNVAGQFVGIAYQVLSTRLNGGYLPGRITQYCFKYLEYCVGISVVYKQLKAHVEPLLCGIIFPMLCFNDEDQELWESDPQEYVRKSTDPFTEYVNPQVAAVNLLIMITKQRTKDTLNMYLTFLNNILVQYSQAPGVLENVRRKDGALFSIGAMYEKLSKKAEYKGPVEQLLLNQVLPEFQSPHGFMRTRACWTVSMYTQFEYTDRNTRVAMLQAVANCLRDPELPVRVAAGMALKLLLVSLSEDDQDIAEVLRPVLPQLLEAFLALMNDIDNEDLIASLEIVVTKFDDAIGPYAVQLCTQLGNAYCRLAVEGDDNEDEFASAMAATEAIHTLNTILASCVKQPQVFVALEPLIVQVVVQSLEEYNIEYLEEALETLTLHTYAVPEISPATWQLLPMLHQAFKAHASSFLEFYVGVLDNYISRAPDAFLANPSNMEILRQMVVFVLESQVAEGVELRSAAELVQVLFNNCKGKVDAALLPFFTPLVTRLSKERCKVTKVEMIDSIAAGLYYNPILMLQMMESQGWTQGIFTIWNALATEDKLSRRKDKRMSLLGLGSLLSLDSTQLPATIQSMLPGLVNMCAGLCLALDAMPEPGSQEEFAGDYDDDDNANDDDGELGDDEDYGGKTDAVIQQIIQDKIQKFKDGELDDEDEDDDSDWEEFDDIGDDDDDDESPLSLIEPTSFFRQTLEANANAPQLLAQLDAEGQARLQQAFVVAEKRAKKHQEAQAAGAAQ